MFFILILPNDKRYLFNLNVTLYEIQCPKKLKDLKHNYSSMIPVI